jgi:hypothetical protein
MKERRTPWREGGERWMTFDIAVVKLMDPETKRADFVRNGVIEKLVELLFFFTF